MRARHGSRARARRRRSTSSRCAVGRAREARGRHIDARGADRRRRDAATRDARHVRVRRAARAGAGGVRAGRGRELRAGADAVRRVVAKETEKRGRGAHQEDVQPVAPGPGVHDAVSVPELLQSQGGGEQKTREKAQGWAGGGFARGASANDDARTRPVCAQQRARNADARVGFDATRARDDETRARGEED